MLSTNRHTEKPKMEIPSVIVETVKNLLSQYGDASRITEDRLKSLFMESSQKETEDEYLTKKEAARIMRCTTQTIWNRMKQGDLTYFHLSKNTTLISRKSVLHFMEKHRTPATA